MVDGRHKLWRLALFLSAIVLATASAAAAQVGGTLTGTVKDPTGGVLPGVTVTSTNTVLGTTLTTVTDAQGLYSFPKLVVGRYDVTFHIEGFTAQRHSGIQIDAGSAVQVNASLELGDKTETVTVAVNA